MKIKEIKLRKIIQCDREESIVDVAKKLRKNKERHIVVTDKKRPVGIISTTDITNRVVAENKNLSKTTAKQIMTTQIMVRDIEESLGKVYFEMIKQSIFSCPITKKDKLVGILDLKNATSSLIKAKLRK